jgi:hypothetical protein
MKLEPIMGSLPQYGWRNQKATINNAAKSGEKFSNLPGKYKLGPGQIPRGGNVPQGPGLSDKPDYESYGSVTRDLTPTNQLINRATPRLIPGQRFVR